MRSPVVAAVVAVGLLEVRAARAEDPCAADVKQLCGDVQVGGGRVQDCLARNEAKLSPACSAKQAAVAARFRQLVQEFSEACRRDADRLCSGVKPGRGRVVACLLRQQDDLSSSCRAQTDRVQTASETITAVRTACRADVERLCAGATQTAGPLVECLQANRASVSETCRSVDPEMGARAAELVDAIEALSSEERAQEALQILQGIESIAFSRSQVLFQFDSFHGLGGSANANRLIFNPQVVFGHRQEFSVQLKAPVLAVYPYAPERSAKTGLGAVTTSFVWGFGQGRVHQYFALGLQWLSPVEPPVGSAWAVTPGYAISVGIARWLSLTAQLAWIRSFASSGYPELNLLLVDPILVVNLPGRTFAALDTKLGWNLVSRSFVPVMKGIVGIYINRQKSVSISAWYQASLSDAAEAEIFKFGVGTALAYFFDW